MTAEQMLDLVKDLVVATLEMIEIEQKINISDANRVNNILSEATTQLRDGLDGMDDAFETLDAGETDALKQAYRMLRQESIEALQFDDIVSLILAQCTRRGDSMLNALYRLYEVIESLEMHDPYVDLVRMRARFRREAQRHRTTVSQFDSVKQSSLENGEIELF
jgi:hypothetical protein